MSESTVRRRTFLHATLAGAAGITAFANTQSKAAFEARRFDEPSRQLPLDEDADVIVCGAGPAGIAAALASARTGAKTRLFEVHGCLGGVWTAGLLTYIFDFDKPGLTREIVRILDEREARRSQNSSRFVYEPEEMKILLEKLCAAAGVEIQLFTRVVAAYREGKRLRTIVTESKAGRQAWRAPVYIDATGDGDLGALADCQWEVGQLKDFPCQPMTMNALAVVRNAEAIGRFMFFYGSNSFRGEGRHLSAVEAFKGELQRAGVTASYGHPTIFPVREDLRHVDAQSRVRYQALGGRRHFASHDAFKNGDFKIMRALRKLGGPWEGFQIAATAEQIGVRDGRRIRGKYQVTRDDLVKGARHNDAVTRATFGVDIHAHSKEANRKEPISRADTKAKPYDIPLRALIAEDVDGLMMAGRCISGDFVAHASYRVTGNAVAMGEAAGAVAAIAAQSNRLPHEVNWKEGADLLVKIGLRE